MTEQCVILVVSNPSTEYAGSVPNVQTMTFVQCAIMVTNIISDTDSSGLTPQEVAGKLKD